VDGASNVVATGTAFNGAESSVNLAWADDATNELGYAVERCPGASCSAFVEIGRTGENATGFRDTPLPAGTTYGYRVRALGFTGNSAYSNAATATTPGDPTPAAPAALSASSNARRTISLAWINTAMNATSIIVERCKGSMCTGFTPVAQLAATASFWTDSGLRSGFTYRYRVYASNSAGSSPPSNIATATAR
jgi:predicted phage tail protein